MLKKIREIFFPETYSCLCCNRDVFDNPYLFCNKCIQKLPMLDGRVCLHCCEPLVSDGNYCIRCKGKNFVCDRAISPFKYEGIAKKLVKDLKFEGKKYSAIPLAKFMADCFKKSKLYVDIIVAVPLCEKRFKERGFNQSDILIDELTKYISIPTSSGNLIRVVETMAQSELNFSERQKNLINAFKITNPDEFADKSVLLIDDVYTTGATTNECCRMLKLAGAKAVYVLTACHTVLTLDKNEEGEL